MKHTIFAILFFISSNLFAQKPCEYNTNVTDSLGTYKTTKECLVSEKIFGGKSSYIFYSLVSIDGVPVLNVQLIQKSKEFMKANCFDKNSKLYLQLNNGKIITLIHTNQDDCGSMVRDDKGFDNRVMSGFFIFTKDNFEDLKNYPLSLMRIKYLTDTEDYVIQKELKSELNNQVYNPDTYFINNLRCIE